ncbi:MAG: YitT family protein [Eubacterium sp.]|nr:YitT family protein [Eubacterium sp.]
MWKHKKLSIKNILQIALGTMIYAVGIGIFLDPNKLAPGGVMGIGVILSHTIGLGAGSWYFILNVPILILGWYNFGGRMIIATVYAVICNSLFTNFFSRIHTQPVDLFPATMAGSVLAGVGLGLVLKAGATTGGMDIVVKILRRKYKYIKTGTLFLILDLAVVVASGFVFKNINNVMYAFLAVIVTGKVLDYVLYGADEARMILIVSDRSDELVKRILEELDVGATLLKGSGAYTKQNKEMILCVVKKRQAPDLEELVKEEDPHAFMILTNADEIYGEGYKNLMEEKL